MSESKDVRGNIYGLGLCGTALALLVEAPPVFVFFTMCVIAPLSVGITRNFWKLKAVEKPGAVFADGCGLILQDLKVGQPAEGIEEENLYKGVTKIAKFARISLATATENRWWVRGKDVTDISWVVLGPRGSCKSLTMRWMAREAVRDGATVHWFDWHHNPEHEQHIDVLPGIPYDDYVRDSKDKMMATLRALLKLGEERIQGVHGKDFDPVVVFWDEFQDITSTALRDPFDFADQEFANDAVRLIQDGFRKAKIQIVVSLKSVKKGQSGLDMSTLLQCNWLFTGAKGKNFSALEDKSAMFPDEISENRSRLISEAKAMYDQGKGTQGAVCMVDGEAVTKCHPETMALVNMLKSDDGFEVEVEVDEHVETDVINDIAKFFAPHMVDIEKCIKIGYSKSKIFDAIPGHGQRSSKNPKWVWFSQMFDEVKVNLIKVA